MRPVAVAVLAATAVAAPAQQRPLETALEERIAVRLVLLDVTVTDRDGEPVVDLAADDFDVRIGGRRVELVSFDAFCDAGPDTDPAGPVPDVGRLVLAFDYDHMHNAAETLERAIRAVGEAPAGVPQMVVALGATLRIEQPFDDDPARTVETLERMRDDPTLWAAPSGRLTEKRFFERMLTLFDLLEQRPGRTTVALFSGPFDSDGFTYDTLIQRIAARAARTRTAIYTVDSGGLRPTIGLGGPTMLRRVAHATGGRPTADTNDIGLAYRRAAEALRCSYTLGFHDPRPELDRPRRVRVDVWRPGHRVAHAGSYVERSERAARRSLAGSALVAPALFPDDGLSAEVVPLADESIRRRLRVDVGFRRPEPADGSRRVRAAVVKPNGTTIRRIRIAGGTAAAGGWRGSGELRLRPGEYELRVVVSDSALDTPHAVRLPLRVR